MNLPADRLEAVESRVAWLEKSLADLDLVVRELGDELRHMRVELTQLRETQSAVAGDGEAGPRYEVPPHY